MKRLFILALVACACCSRASGKKTRWCTVSEAEQKKCADLAKALATVLPPGVLATFGRMSCVRAYSTADCISKIWANRADAVTLDAGEVYTAVKQFDLTAVAKEIYRDGGCVFAVAVVRNGDLNIRSLKGHRSCHSGVRWTAGWNLPLGFLLSRNYLHWAEEQPLSQVVSEFFNASCAPGTRTMATSLCALCQGEKSYVPHRNSHCETSHNEPFFNSQGALRCLRTGKGDVAFVDHIALENIDEQEKGHYRLLCTNGSLAPLSDFGRCNLGQGPGGGVVTRFNYRRVIRKFLTTIQVAFGRQGRQRERFQLFESRPYGTGNLLFQDATHKLAILNDDSDMSQVLGLDYMALLKGLRHEGSTLEDSVIRWCCISAAEQHKCEQWALSVKSDPLVCVRASSMSNCIEKIKRDEVDAVSLDATHAFIAGKCGLVPVATEYYGEKCLSWKNRTAEIASFKSDGEEMFLPMFAVAVVRRSSKNLLFENLEGRRSCHGHMYSPAGWLLPARHIVGSQPNSSAPCDPTLVYSQVFWKGCLPGSKGGLCKVCVGGKVEPGSKRCVDNHNERYYGNMGALRCLVGDPSGKSYGDVAFLEQHNLEDNIHGLSSSGWAEGWLPEDFELLCGDGRRAPLSQWESCHLGAIPPSVIMTRPVLTSRVYNFLMKSQETLESHLDLEFQLFESQSYGESDLLFKDATRCLIYTSHLDYRTILGEEFHEAVEAVFNCTRAGGSSLLLLLQTEGGPVFPT
ncbi:saxiphilin-like [Scleropages formosus]|uniref:saxiphilin-like n=1 Tax=Scleropages formosus TaxID=113540 RepID=UPI000878D114|nr:saxiphilin-like [Scleropages formosus]